MAETNPYTGRPYSNRYYEILEKRQQLPVFEAKERIQKLVRKYQVTLLVGETGSGKTTQVPQFLMEMEPDAAIACTQPRRVAAMTVSARVAEEMDVKLGDEVGYTIRFDDVSSEKTKIKYLTDGMLLREGTMDPLLNNYSVIVVDEAHERSVPTDILLGTLKQLCEKRPELRLVVMSATLEEKKFQKYFSDAPLIHISGRMFGVETYFSRLPEANYVEGCIRTAIQIHLCEGPGDILVFLTGEDEIETAVERIEYGANMAAHSTAGANKGPLVCLPLYSALPPKQQKKVFEPVAEGTRKIVVSTNIAETSVTIDGVVFVVDSGFSKQKVFNPKLRLESLLVTPISQAAARQRTGRAGRTRPGKCFRLYTKNSYESLLQPQTYPEILRTNLGAVVLNLKKMGIDDLVHFDFIDPPAPATLMRALELLNWLGALNDDGDLTPLGEQMSHFPLDPEPSAMLIKACTDFKCGDEAAKIASILSVQSCFVNDHSTAAKRAKEQFNHPTGDHMAALQLYEAAEEAGFDSNWCHENFLNHRPLKQASSIHRQLTGILGRLGLDYKSYDDSEDRQFANHIRKAILSGFFPNLAMSLPNKSEFQTLKDNVKAIFFPTTCLTRKPSFVIYNELVMTSNNYVRTVTSVSDDWLIEACPGYFEDLEDFSGLQLAAVKSLWKRYNLDQERKTKKSGGATGSRKSKVEESSDDDE